MQGTCSIQGWLPGEGRLMCAGQDRKHPDPGKRSQDLPCSEGPGGGPGNGHFFLGFRKSDGFAKKVSPKERASFFLLRMLIVDVT